MKRLKQIPACGQPVHGGGTCQLSAHHVGYHSTVAFVCDGCGERHRGRPYRCTRDGEIEKGLKFCFLCAKDES